MTLKTSSVKKEKANIPLTLRTVNELLFRYLLLYGYLVLFISRVGNVVTVHARFHLAGGRVICLSPLKTTKVVYSASAFLVLSTF
jgi:hypothetical protein